MRIPSSDRDKACMDALDDEHLFTRDMRDLLIAPAICYCGFTDDALHRYLKGAVRRFKHLQTLRALAYCAADEDGRF